MLHKTKSTLVITVANSERTISKEKRSKFTWETHGTKFDLDAELRVISLGGCDIILGHDWMWKYDLVTFALKKNCLIVTKAGKQCKLQ